MKLQISLLSAVLLTLQLTVFPAAAESTPIVFSFGSNEYGRTGLGTDVGDTLVATPIDTTNLAGKSIAQVAAGGTHNLLLADDGSVFSFGHNQYGQTGLGTDIGNTLLATPILTTNLAGKRITQVAAGKSHSLLLADDGSVFSFGGNQIGQTGLGTNSGNTLLATPILATNLAGKSITQVAAGGVHSLLLADDGSVFSFGHNGWGPTGQGTNSGFTPVATPIDTTHLGGRAITQVAAGYFHSLLLADDGSVFSFGFNGRGETGQGTDIGGTLVATPIVATNLAGKPITQVAAGENYSLLLADDGSVFSFGNNAFGKTGLGTDGGFTLVATPIDTTNLAGKSITQVAAGHSHSLLLADDGSVFSMGRDGGTGMGTGNGDTLVATPIDTTNLAGKSITRVAAGGSTSLANGTHSLLTAVFDALPGDFNADGFVDGRDFLAWQREPRLENLAAWQANYGAASSIGNSLAVPEPTCGWLALSAIPLIASYRARRKA